MGYERNVGIRRKRKGKRKGRDEELNMNRRGKKIKGIVCIISWKKVKER